MLHSLDVAAVAHQLLQSETWLLPQLKRMLGWETNGLQFLLTWLISLHDLGKFADIFQHQQPRLRALHLDRRTPPCTARTRHDLISGCIFQQKLVSLIKKEGWFKPSPMSPGRPKLNWLLSLGYAIAGHHGLPLSCDTLSLETVMPFPQDREAAIEFARRSFKLLMPEDFSLPDPLPKDSKIKRASWLVAGLTVLADWLGSGTQWFQYAGGEHELKELLNQPDPLQHYWTTRALPAAQKALEESNVLPACPTRLTGLQDLFPQLREPTPLQTLAQQLPLQDGPQLFFMEETTGGGKTEAALLLASRLLAAGQGRAIFFALPTMATANTLYKRLSTCYSRLFETPASLRLSHGAALHHTMYQQSIATRPTSGSVRLEPLTEQMLYESPLLDNTGILPEMRLSKSIQEDRDTASVWCSQWLADSRKKSLLASLGVGTLDQALLGVLPSKHQSLRLYGLSRSVLIVDEVHAYDAYTNELLKCLLKFHVTLGGSAILISATLPARLKKELHESWREALAGSPHEQSSSGPGNEAPPANRPLLTHCYSGGSTAYPFETRTSQKRNMHIHMSHREEEVIQYLTEQVEQGACACWIRNTVDDAREGYERLRARGLQQVQLFHARFALGDRLRHEETVLQRFGPDSGPAERRGWLLVATQIVEQSLDLDFDVMVTDLAPLELIIQRAGRLHRHLRTLQGTRMLTPEIQPSPPRPAPVLWIHGPPPLHDASADWYRAYFPGASWVYADHAQLWKTAELLRHRRSFHVPEDTWIVLEQLYGDDSPHVPPALKQSQQKVETEQNRQESIALQNRLNLDMGYEKVAARTEEDATQTRLADPTLTVRLIRRDGARLW
ncbi:MAG: CRISPR-associated helicase Cas3', partial [Myxococcota bacterium]